MSTQRKRTRSEDSDEEFEFVSQSTQRVKTVANEYEEEEMQRKVKDIVRYALSCEFKRKTIRREELQKFVNAKRSFQEILNRAKDTLKQVFGFELIELPLLKMNQSATQLNSLTMTQVDTQKKPNSANGYVLRSILKEDYRTPEIIERSTEEYKHTGFLYVVLGLIFLGGQTMTSIDLFQHLDHLKMKKNSTLESKDREKLLDFFIKNNYLKKQQTQDIESEEVVYNYSWGPRAAVEIGHAGIVEFLTSFYNVSESQKTDLQRKMWTQAGYSFRD